MMICSSGLYYLIQDIAAGTGERNEPPETAPERSPSRTESEQREKRREVLRNSEDIEHIEARANQEKYYKRTPRKHPQSREKAARNEQFFGTFSAKKDHCRKWWSELYQNPEPLPCRWILVHSFSDGEALTLEGCRGTAAACTCDRMS